MSVTADSEIRFAINLGNAVLAKTLPDGAPGGITVEIACKIAAAVRHLPRRRKSGGRCAK